MAYRYYMWPVCVLFFLFTRPLIYSLFFPSLIFLNLWKLLRVYLFLAFWNLTVRVPYVDFFSFRVLNTWCALSVWKRLFGTFSWMRLLIISFWFLFSFSNSFYWDDRPSWPIFWLSHIFFAVFHLFLLLYCCWVFIYYHKLSYIKFPRAFVFGPCE